MKTSRLLLISILSIALSLQQVSACASNLTELLNEIDRLIVNENDYVKAKGISLSAIKDQLSLAVDESDRFILLYALSKGYETYQCDSAITYAEAAIRAAKAQGSTSNETTAKIQLSTCLGKAGIFDECISLLNSLNESAMSEKQLTDYYQSCISCCIFMLEYRGGYDSDEISIREKEYQKKMLDLDGGRNSYDAVKVKAIMGLESGDHESVKALMDEYMERVPDRSPEMANLASILSQAYIQSGNTEKWKEYLAISAIADLTSCVRENISLRILALQMYDEGDLTRADMYIRKSLEDANFYNARLRNVQIAKVIPAISNAFQQERTKQQTILRRWLIAAGVMAIILLIGLIFIILQMRQIRRVNADIEEMNRKLNRLNEKIQDTFDSERLTSLRLAEANRVKELFIRDILDICTDYIYKLKTFRRQVNAKLKSGQSANLLKLASRSLTSSQEKENRYASFDRAFLKIYPTFIHEFNLQLKEDQRYPEIENPTELNQELRIFALVKLGISDMSKIQIFLDYSPRTIYNYRSKIKQKLLDKEGDIDEIARQLCSTDNLL